MTKQIFIPDFARTHKLRTKLCGQKSGITPPKQKNLFEIFLGGPSGRFCFAKSGFIAAIILAMIHPAQAVMVKYIDEFGKMHYADTDYTNVPEKYYYQVKDQIEKAQKQDTKAAPAEEKPAPKAPLESTVSSKTGSPFLTPAVPTTENQTKNVELYVKADCSQCFLLESVLRQRKIIYAKYDVESDLGRHKYRALGVKEVPVTKVGGQIIVGFDLNGIYAALNDK